MHTRPMIGNLVQGVTMDEVVAELKRVGRWSYAYELCPDDRHASIQSVSNALRHAEGYRRVKRISNGRRAALWGLPHWLRPLSPSAVPSGDDLTKEEQA